MSRPGGYLMLGDECFSFRRAACFESDPPGDLTLEAEGETCLLTLPNVVWQSRTGYIQDILGTPFPYEVPWRVPEADRLDRLGFVFIPDQEDLDRCELWAAGRLLEVVRVRVEFDEVDVARSLVTADVRVLAATEMGDWWGEFEGWLCCAYDGELFPESE